MMMCWNENQALKAMCDGVSWTGCGFNNGQEVEAELTAGPLCREVLQDVFKFLPLQMTPASAEEDVAPGRPRGRPHGYQEWEAVLKGEPTGLSHGEAWQQQVQRALPSAGELEVRYDEYFGCGREEDGKPCSCRTCSYCWRSRGEGLVRRKVIVSNHWGGAAREASGGTGTTALDQKEEERGLGRTTLDKVAFFFKHQGNDWRQGRKKKAPPGEFTVWVALAEYVTAGVGTSRKVDQSTGLDEFKMRQTLTFYPASCT